MLTKLMETKKNIKNKLFRKFVSSFHVMMAVFKSKHLDILDVFSTVSQNFIEILTFIMH